MIASSGSQLEVVVAAAQTRVSHLVSARCGDALDEVIPHGIYSSLEILINLSLPEQQQRSSGNLIERSPFIQALKRLHRHYRKVFLTRIQPLTQEPGTSPQNNPYATRPSKRAW